jgi:glycerol kinase
MAKNTYGTGCFMLMNTGKKRVTSSHGLLTTIAWSLNGKITYALEGSIFIAGAAIKWLRDEMKIIRSSNESSDLAKNIADTGGVYFVPAFSGLGAPYWDMYAKGMITGITRGTGIEEITRAALESIAYQTRDVLEAMVKDSGIEIKCLKVDGGAANNDFLMQFQSDILSVPVEKPENIESTVLGVAYLAGLCTGFWSMEEILKFNESNKSYQPSLHAEKREKLYEGWKQAVNRTKTKKEKI